ncbi:ABC transporter ATP-binding protein [Virgibacillus byunsanensis]|uniref:ABC transporter ATP-binding protein n=1 Tax=Virgibacillus byunsanensis TaxID=570945 RepID=A0ABW3LHG5_9BACI
MIVAKNLSKKYNSKEVLQPLDLTIEPNEIVGIIGPNGCGKSTLMKLLSGAEKPTSGTVQIKGKLLKKYKTKDLAKILAVLQQEGIPPVGFTVREMIEMGRYPYQNWLGDEVNMEANWEYDIAYEIMERLHIDHLENEVINHLSGGEKQRIALGQVLAQEPEILMLDEPTTYLDIGHQLQMMELIRKWQKKSQHTVVVILHDLNLASMYCTRLILMKDGRIQKIGSPEEVVQERIIKTVYGTQPIVIEHPRQLMAPQIILDRL